MPQGTLTFTVGTRPLRIRVATASPPGVVTGLSVTTISASQLNVSWGASAGATGYVLRRSPDGSSWSQIATPSMTSYSDTGLTAGTTYDYQVEAVGPGGNSGWSATASGMTQSSGGSGAPAAPTGLSATAGTDAIGPHVALSWAWSQGSGGAATAFKVEASDSVASPGNGDGGGFRWRPAHTVPATQTSCKVYSCDAYPIGGRTLTWAFRVTAINDAGFAGTTQQTAYSNTATVTTPVSSRPAPGAPTRVQVTAGAAIATGLYGAGTAAGTPVNISVLPADDATLHIEWNQADDNEVQFDLRYSTDDATWTTITAATSSLVTRYYLAGLSTSTAYYVQVRATNEAGSSSWVTLTTGPTGTTPTAVSTLGTGQVYSLTGANPPALWTAQKDWRLRQAQADYNASAGNDAANQFSHLMACANNFKLGPASANTDDYGQSAALMFQCTGTTSWATYVWDYVFAPGVLPAGTNVGESSGVGWDGTISTTPSSSASGSIWATSLASNSTTSNDPRIYEGRILFLTGALAGQHVQVIGYDGAGNVTIGTPTVALTGTPSAGDSFQLVPYPFHPTNSSDTVDNYHQQAGFILDIAMLLWPWFSATQIRQVTNMFNWWADCHIGVDQAGTPNTWDVITYSHDDCMVGTATTLVIDQCVPDNPLKGRWLNQAYYGAQIPPMVTTGTMDPGGATSTTFGYSDKSSYRNTVLHWALCGRGGRYIVGDMYDTGDAREALCSMEIAQTVLGTDHWPEWRRLWVDFIKWLLYASTPDKANTLIIGDDQNTNVSAYPADRIVIVANNISRPKQVAGAVRGHPNAQYLYQFEYEWQNLAGVGYTDDWSESYLHQDWYPVRTDWRSTLPYGLFCQGAGTLYFQNGWGASSDCYCINFYAERAVDHGHVCASNIQIYRKGTFAYSEPVGYGGPMVDGNAQTNSPMHCGLGPMWVAGVEAADTSSNNYGYICWSTHGNYYPPNNPANQELIYNKYAISNTNTNEYVDTFVLEGTRSAVVLPGTDGHSATVVLCDRMWDVNPRNLSNWGSALGYSKQAYTKVGSSSTGTITTPPTSGAITPTTTQFSTNYTTSSAISSLVTFTTGANAGQSSFMVVTAASATIAAGGSGYQVGDVLSVVGGWSLLQSGSALSSSATANRATFTVSSVSGGAVTGITATNPGAYVSQPAATVNTTGGHGTACTLAVTYAPAWSGSPAYAATVYPPFSVAPSAGDQLTISAHLHSYRVTQFATALQALSFHAPTVPTVSGSSASWTLPQDSSQGCTVSVVYPASPAITVHDESDPSHINTYNGPYWEVPISVANAAAEIQHQIEVQPNATPFPAGTTPDFNVLVSVINAYDSGYAATLASVSSTGGEAQGVLVSRSGLSDVLVMFGAREGYRVHQSGYSVTYAATTATSTVYLCDLDPSRSNSYTLDGGASTPFIPTAAGVAAIAVSGATSHTIVLSVV